VHFQVGSICLSFGQDLVGIAFNENGELFGSVSASSFGTVDLVRIDLSTGAATVVGQPVPQADARALAFIPEPGTGVLLALASLFLAGRRSRTCGSTLREAGGDPPP